ncbi:inner centromere protein A isoform X1 [Xenopus laevis]|nr:inner centromere protein A isoform X1 [Xenopus laevis]
MNDAECLSHLLQVCARKTEEFVRTLDSKHMVWLLEIEEEARKMFSSDFNAEPELMPKTPSQKRRRKKRTSILPDENRDPSGRRISRRQSNASWSSSVRRLSVRNQNKANDDSIQEEPAQLKRMTRARAQASIKSTPVLEKALPESPSQICQKNAQVKISEQERRSAEQKLIESDFELKTVPEITKDNVSETVNSAVPAVPVTPENKSRAAGKLKIAASSTPEQKAEMVDLTCESPRPANEQQLNLSNQSATPTGSKSDRRSVRRSLVVRKSSSRRASLASQFSLASKRESMTREAVRKSIRQSISQKKAAMEISSTSSQRSYQSSIEMVDDEITIKIRPETVPSETVSEEAPAAESPRRSLRSRAFKKIAISNLPDSEEPPRKVTRQMVAGNAEPTPETTEDAQNIRRKSYKRAVDELSDDERPSEEERSPPRKKTPSPPCPPSKIVRPPPHMKSFLHTVQKNQLLMMTPGSIGKNIIMKSFIKRNTPLKTDPKTEEKERQRLDALRKKEEAELQRKQKIEEGKKRKQEELKVRREERLRKVLQARERVEQLEEEKKKKIEQKFAQIDEKSEKVREDRMAEEKAKKKMTAKKQEEVECRRKQEEEARRLKVKQMEEEERRHQELLQKKREEEELERQKKIAEAKRLAEQERERQLLAEKERLRAEREKERIEKEKALQLQRELERAAQEKEQQRREAEERKKREQQERLEQERLRKEQETKRLQEEEQRKAKEQAAVAASAPVMNVTVDMQNSPACESYEMTPKSCKVPSVKVNEDNYGMDLNSDDSTDDESQPRKPIPAWASGNLLTQAIRQQYYKPIDVDRMYGTIDSPKLEELFNKSKPRYFKRTSSAVWHSPPLSSNRHHLAVGYGLKY